MIGTKWKLLILGSLLSGTKRYNQLHREVAGVSQKMLTASLKEMVEDGIVQRVSYPVSPPKVEYSLTELGESMRPLIWAMESWGQNHQNK